MEVLNISLVNKDSKEFLESVEVIFDSLLQIFLYNKNDIEKNKGNIYTKISKILIEAMKTNTNVRFILVKKLENVFNSLIN